MILPEPQNAALLRVRLDTFGEKEEREHYITRKRVGWYRAEWSGGQIIHTADDAGPNGEPIEGYAEYHLQYVGYFDTWDSYLTFLKALRAEVLEAMID